MVKKVTQQKRSVAKRKRRDARKSHKAPQQRPGPQSGELLTVPIWEYGTLATAMTLENPEQLRYHEVLAYLMSVPIYMAKPGKKPRAGLPQDIMAAGNATPEQFLDLIQNLYQGGFIEWDQDKLVHILSMPPE